MDRRNFFVLAGAAGAALTAGAVTGDAEAAPDRMMARRGGDSGRALLRASKTFAGTSLDRDIVRIAVRGGGGGAAFDDDDGIYRICGPWMLYIHRGPWQVDWQDPVKEFGGNFARLSLSQMISTVSRARGGDVAISVSRDGAIRVGA